MSAITTKNTTSITQQLANWSGEGDAHFECRAAFNSCRSGCQFCSTGRASAAATSCCARVTTQVLQRARTRSRDKHRQLQQPLRLCPQRPVD